MSTKKTEELEKKIQKKIGTVTTAKASLGLLSVKKTSKLNVKKINKLAKELRQIDKEKDDGSNFFAIPAY